MATVVGIANDALRRIGAKTITSFTQGTDPANAINDVYDGVRDELLRSHNWNFATKRVKLAQVSTAPVFGHDHAYSMPSDWLRTVSVHNNDEGAGTIEYKTENQGNAVVIVTSADDVYLRYVSRVSDPNLMPPDFRKALSRRLAEAVCVDLTSSNTLRREVADEAKEIERRAKSTDAMGSSPERRPRGSWANSRSGRWRTGPFEGE